MGVKNSSAHFQHQMQKLLVGLDDACEVYIDDVTIWGSDEEEFIHNLDQVLGRLNSVNLRLKETKCHFGIGRVEVLGFMVDGQGTSLSESRLQGLKGVQPPRDLSTLRSFMGMAGFLRGYVNNFAMVCQPLTSIMSPKKQFHWGKEQQEAFEQVRDQLLNAPMLHHINYDAPIIVRTDASLRGCGAALLQVVQKQ